MKAKALIAMSGGVDSSVAAYLMQKQGYDCIGATMKLYHNTDIGLSENCACCSADDREDARAVAASMNIPHYVFNFSDLFREKVMDKFVHCYECGITPNPCIDCNRHLKFEFLHRRAAELGCDYVATGHYAQIIKDSETDRYLLMKSADIGKDQSYVLYTLTQEQLSRTCFPLGGMTKTEVRTLADAQGFINAKKHESQDICFVPDGNYTAFIENYTGKTYPAGDFIDTDGNVLGRHKGIIRYTIGQRRGLGLSLKEPMYVMSVNPADNTVTLGRDSALFSRKLIAHDVNLISVADITEPIRVKAKVRYRHTEQWATVTRTDTDSISVVFDEPQRAITRGQAVVLYDGDIVVGGGTIAETTI